LAASWLLRDVPGTARSSRCTSASLPVLSTPSSVSTAASSVTSQSGCGVGPCCPMSQVDQRSPVVGASSDGVGSAGRRRTGPTSSTSSSKRCRWRRVGVSSKRLRRTGSRSCCGTEGSPRELRPRNQPEARREGKVRTRCTSQTATSGHLLRCVDSTASTPVGPLHRPQDRRLRTAIRCSMSTTRCAGNRFSGLSARAAGATW
jgi:hypothetical protein